MATSQFIFYSSADIGGPGPINGLTGSLITVLDACLVNGYSSKAGAGWTKPIANYSNVLGCYKQPSGAGMTLFINDGGGNATALGQEAWACGYEQITSLTGSVGSGIIFTGSYGNGQGYGQFPLPSQLLTYGHVVWRKSVSANSVQRPWIIVADSSSFYMWIQTGDTAGIYYHGAFGDFYSLKGSSDLWRCFIYGRSGENSAAVLNVDWTDQISGWNAAPTNILNVAQGGHFIDRSFGGTSPSINFTKKGDSGVCTGEVSSIPYGAIIGGFLQCPNGADNSLYFSPLWVVEPTAVMLRGRFRGLIQICHPNTSFSDGQLIQGSGDYAGKSYVVINRGVAGGFWGVESSPTVETN